MIRHQRKIRLLVYALCRQDRINQQDHRQGEQFRAAKLGVLIFKSNFIGLSPAKNLELALVVHHGGNPHDIRLARDRVRLNLDTQSALLYRQMVDRYFVMKFKRQVFGTQFRSDPLGTFLEPFPSMGPKDHSL